MSLVVVLVLSAIAGVALAQGPVDENDDGVCDVCGEQVGDGLMLGPRNWQGVDADGDGVCDNFVDEDGDGLCDNDGQYAQRSFSGRGGMGGRGNWNQSQDQGFLGQNRQ